MKILTDELINNSKFYLNDRTTIEVLKHKLTAEEWKSIENVYHHIPTIED